jgi:predicted  nucleic acid-binding Zn-ribbon protein
MSVSLVSNELSEYIENLLKDSMKSSGESTKRINKGVTNDYVVIEREGKSLVNKADKIKNITLNLDKLSDNLPSRIMKTRETSEKMLNRFKTLVKEISDDKITEEEVINILNRTKVDYKKYFEYLGITFLGGLSLTASIFILLSLTGLITYTLRKEKKNNNT